MAVTAVAGYREARVAGAHILAREHVLGHVVDAIETHGTLYDHAARHPAAERLRGRGTLYVVPGPATQRWVVRHLAHGGLLASLTGDRFLRWGRPRPFNELRLSVRLRELGVATPPVPAAVVYPSGAVYRGDVARQEIGDSRDLEGCLFGSPRVPASHRTEALAAAGRLVGDLHRVGLIHADLNLRNILIRWDAGRLEAYILDLEKCRLVKHASRAARRRMLRRFARSLRKAERNAERALAEREWGVFLSAYDEAAG